MRLVNFLAKYSLARFNKIRPLRRLCRRGYWLLGELYLCFSPLHHRNLSAIKNGEIIDTYPWPYNNLLFARWPESDDAEDYSLVPDPSGFVVKYATSYCAYKIREAVGVWPKRESKRRRFDAKDWQAFLREAGYWEIDERPSKNFYYVGIQKNSLRPYGEVVWFERYESEPDRVVVSTYDSKIFVPKIVHASSYTWVKIARRETQPAPLRVPRPNISLSPLPNFGRIFYSVYVIMFLT